MSTAKKKHNSNGYYPRVYKPNSLSSFKGLAHEHRVVMEKFIDRSIPHGCIVHHRNQIKTDNCIENLLLLPSEEIHREIHALIDAGKNEDVKKYERYALNFMNNLKAGNPLAESIPGAFLRKKR